MNKLKSKIRDLLEDWKIAPLLEEKPWIKWAAGAVGVLALVLVAMQFMRSRADSLLDADTLGQTLHVKFEDNGETMEVPIGFISRELIDRQGQASETWKLTNPKSGQQTGVVVERRAWAALVKQVNEHKAESAPRP